MKIVSAVVATKGIAMKKFDFSKITACGECCVECKKKEEGLCEGCIESNGHCKEWTESGGCPIHMCAKEHNVQFCGLCDKFPCGDLARKIHWNPNIVEHLTRLTKIYINGGYYESNNYSTR